MKRLALLTLACLAAASCASPEATRQRGGGPGADPGNHAAPVKMHEGSRPYWKTPIRIKGEHMAIDASEQARRLSLPSGSAGEGKQ